jgi:HD domain
VRDAEHQVLITGHDRVMTSRPPGRSTDLHSAPLVCTLPNVQSVVHTRRLSGLAIHATALAALVPAYLWLAPASRWDRPGLLLALLALGVVADFHDVPMPSGIRLDAGMALALIALATLGPLPAYLVDLVPMVVGGLVRREQLVRAGNLANVASYGWKALAAAGVLALGAPSGLSLAVVPWLLLAGAAQVLVNWAVGPAVYGTLWLGHPLRAMTRMLADFLPAATVMLVLASLTSVLTVPLGLLALAVFAGIAVLPQTALTYVGRTRPVARLEARTATQRYAHALALHLGLGRAERRHLAQVCTLAVARREDGGDPVAYARRTLADPSRASVEAGHFGEWWNGGGGPAGLRGAVTPLTARIVAVADTWSALTAHGGPQLSHAEALEELDNASGTRFDPRVVLAAHAVVSEERVSATEPAPEPRLHVLRVPARLRRVLAAA